MDKPEPEGRGDGHPLSTASHTVLPLLADLAGLTIFRDCKTHPLLGAFRALLKEWATVGGDSAGLAVRRLVPGGNSVPRGILSLPRCWAALVREQESFARLASGGDPAGSPGAVAAEESPGGSGDPLMGVRGSFWACVRELALSSDNPFTRAVERGDRITGDETMTGGSAIPPLLTQLARDDLDRLGRIAAFDLSALGFSIALYLRARNLEEAASHIEAEARILWRSEGAGPGDKPDAGPPDRQAPFRPGTPWGAFPEEAAAHIRRRGAGAFSRHRFFRWESGGPALPAAARLTAGGGVPRGVPRPVPYPDPITLSDLVGYESQRSLVLHNTLAFLEGKMASNLLLYGDRGTGKSATVKAVCREYSDRGLRLLELHKEDMAELPGILEFTALRGLSFVVFIDDLSFEGLDDSFTSLKALLEGGAGTRPPNTVIYATSNRRRLVRESPAGRQGSPGSGDGEARSFDTIQEQLSLSDRFGLTVIFTAPSQEEYLRIARGIADRRGVAPDSRFRENALRWEQWFNGRSPRTASQFVDWLRGGKPFPWD